MINKVFISGLQGNMGRRYYFLLKEMGVEVIGCDKDVSLVQQASLAYTRGAEGIIICTPTPTHVDAISIFSTTSLPILVEKPIVQSVYDPDTSVNVRMINQYEYLINKDSVGETSYSYFKTGNDGLYWDCINIIGLANGEVKITNNSPFWSCVINGHRLNLSDMDKAYYDMLADWVDDPQPNYEYQRLAHDKVVDLMNAKNGIKKNPVTFDTKVIPILERKND